MSLRLVTPPPGRNKQNSQGEELLKFGADVNSENEFGRTPLHLAAYGCKLEAALLLLMHGADPNKQDSKGDTPLHDAVFHDAFEIAELLLVRATHTHGRAGSPVLMLVVSVGQDGVA